MIEYTVHTFSSMEWVAQQPQTIDSIDNPHSGQKWTETDSEKRFDTNIVKYYVTTPWVNTLHEWIKLQNDLFLKLLVYEKSVI